MTEREVTYLLQIVLIILMLAVGIILGGMRRERIPAILRPWCVVSGAIIVASVASANLTDDQYVQYVSMWYVQIAGVIFGLAASRIILYSTSQGEVVNINPARLEKISIYTLIVGTVSGIAFFAWQGVPILMSNIEQGRVDAAVVGSGYLRLLAYLTGPASLIYNSVHQGRNGKYAITISILIVVGMANRSPLLYIIIAYLFTLIPVLKFKVTTIKVAATSLFLVIIIATIGAIRVLSQEEFSQYEEYRDDINSENYLGVAYTAFSHYANVVVENAVLTKQLVDSGRIDNQYGLSYLILFITALPGEQLSLDRQIKLASGKSFVGGGTPPTMMGEGYVNFGYAGIFLAGIMIVFLLEYWYRNFLYMDKLDEEPSAKRVSAGIYGYMVCWAVLAQVSGFVGASTVPFAGAIVLTLVWYASRNKM